MNSEFSINTLFYSRITFKQANNVLGERFSYVATPSQFKKVVFQVLKFSLLLHFKVTNNDNEMPNNHTNYLVSNYRRFCTMNTRGAIIRGALSQINQIRTSLKKLVYESILSGTEPPHQASTVLTAELSRSKGNFIRIENCE